LPGLKTKEVMQAELLPHRIQGAEKERALHDLAGQNNAHADGHLRLHSNINPEAKQNEHF
jgi:hypothetical protein